MKTSRNSYEVCPLSASNSLKALGLWIARAGVAYLQYLHRQTQEKLLRIEYHMAELMERATVTC